MVRPVKLDCHEAEMSHDHNLAMAFLRARDNKDPVSIFTPHHTTNIKYPSFSLLAQTEDLTHSDIFMLPVENASERFEPWPLVNDPAIAAHAFRCSHEETAIFSLNPARIGFESGPETIIHLANKWGATKTFTHNALRELGSHMSALSMHQGGTNLSVLTYNNRGQDCVLIKRHTNLFVGQGRLTACPSVMYITTVEGLRSTKLATHSAFMQNLQDVVFRRTDRAFLHVQHMLHCHQPQTSARIHDVAHPWKAKRRPNYESFEFKIAEPIPLESIPADEMSCNTCGNDLDTAAYRPLQMKCCGNHICRHCYTNWADSKGPNHASCIYCRGRFFDDPTAESMTDGTVNGYYYPYLPPNHRFTPYENFERSCADLDRHLAENNPTTIVPDPDLLLRIWDHLLDGARLEDGSTSTPDHLQPARCPEIKTARRILREDVYWLALDEDDAEWSTDSLFAQLWRNQLRGFRDAIVLAGGRTVQEGQGELMHWVEARSPHFATDAQTVAQWLRPGTLEFVRRTLNRMLQFVHVRVCRRAEEMGAGRLVEDTPCAGLHGHGARMYVGTMWEGKAREWREGYFDPEVGGLLCWREPIDGSPMREWEEEEEEDEEGSEDDYFSDGDEEGSSSPPRATSPTREDLQHAAARANIPPPLREGPQYAAGMTLSADWGAGGFTNRPEVSHRGPPAFTSRTGVSFPPRRGPPSPVRGVRSPQQPAGSRLQDLVRRDLAEPRRDLQDRGQSP
ncbi:hypothetical protein KC360_g8797 [Hortaea werneckii]|nr:hypothetical protein KC325_g8749 [Hortaea werneckii]KAI6986177.1 hypothetical protein KC359_g8869 [Hortaea werneckii]KAI7140401.1 hypothetical protein KC344_g8749 [Hortaea werneckii]KAI7167184.1 hypothetical protein KC360_g8797 [Hortaea werneckii]